MDLNPFERLVLRLTNEGTGARLVEYGGRMAQARLPDGGVVVLMAAGDGALRGVQQLADDVTSKVRKAKIVIVGGDDELARWITSVARRSSCSRSTAAGTSWRASAAWRARS